MLVETVDDIFLHDLSLTRSALFFPLGFPVELNTNSDAVIAAARDSWENFEQSHAEFPLVINLAVTDEDSDRKPSRPKFRSHGHLMSIVSDAQNQIICDLARGYAAGWLTRRVLEDVAAMRLRYLESTALILLVNAHLAPFHGALITRNGVGVALCGESFAGKSTLAYACARAGWTFVSDDGTFLVRKDTNRYAMGLPHSLRFRADAKNLFPELERFRVQRRVNGKEGIELRTRDLEITTANGCSIDHLVFLRRPSQPSINPMDSAEALAWLESTAVYGSQEVQEAQRQSYRRLLGAGLWELHYTDVIDAIEILNGLGNRT